MASIEEVALYDWNMNQALEDRVDEASVAKVLEAALRLAELDGLSHFDGDLLLQLSVGLARLRVAIR